MKKILVISSSPRSGGNSDVLCDQFIKGASENGHSVKKVFLQKEKLNYCLACYKCRETERCIHKDSMNDIIDMMVEADVIVLASPVYFYTIDGQMKVFIDRCLPKYLQMNNKEFYFIVTAADDSIPAMNRTIECLRGFLDCLENPIEKGIIYGVGAWEKDDVLDLPVFDLAYRMGKEV